MSPEQVEFGSRDVDTRSDIYSLGVILYELMTGHPPFDPKALAKVGLDEMRRLIRESDPPRPSTRLTQGFSTPKVGRVPKLLIRLSLSETLSETLSNWAKNRRFRQRLPTKVADKGDLGAGSKVGRVTPCAPLSSNESGAIGGAHGVTRPTVTSEAGTAASRRLHDIRGDVDWIVMKCLEKD